MDYELIKPDEQDRYDPAPFLNYARARRTDKDERDPDVGDWVHYWTGDECWAALVTRDDLFSVWLSCVAPGETSLRPVRDVPHIEGTKAQGSWHWPCGGH
ncbi:hypothetical protein OG381_34345 [Streptomyces sp. NBC_00490]|uniref:hypothetical protein n=1 Tax=Streptomyces sp. NBC_00490 TaxID=2903657 RepID=UPI002E197C22